nr:uncharacterized protein LOC127328455 [Lolium perenne]
MAAIPPPAPGASHSPSTPLPPPGPPILADSLPPSSIPSLQSTSPKASDGKPRARPATAPIKLGLDGGEPPPGTDGVGRVGSQEIDGGEPERGNDGGGDAQMRTDAGGGKRPERKKPNGSSLVPTIIKASQIQLGEGKLHKGKTRKPRSEKIRNIKGDLPMGSKSTSPLLRSPVQLTSSPGVNMLARSVAVKRASVIERVASIKRAKMTGSPKASHHPPSFTQLSSPSLEDLSPGTRTTNSHASKRRRRKLISAIWTEAEPIYKDGKLVEGRCIHCHQIFAASRDSGTSHIKRHLKVCDAQTAMTEMVDRMGRSDSRDPNWKYDPKVARRKLVKLIVVNEMPFSLVEYAPFREFTASLNPWFENVSRTTIKNECMDAFNDHGNALRDYFENCSSRISLTGDMWTSNRNRDTSHDLSLDF